MKFGLCLHELSEGALDARVKYAALSGYSLAQLNLIQLLPDAPSTPGAMTMGFAQGVKNLFRRHDVHLCALECNLNLLSPDPELAQAADEMLRAHLLLCAMLGDCALLIGSGRAQRRGEGDWMLLAQRLEPLVRFAERLGVRIALEPRAGDAVDGIQRALDVLGALPSKSLRLALDPVMLLSSDNWIRRDALIVNALEALGSQAIHLHLRDYRLVEGQIRLLPVGMGEMDYYPLTRLIKRELSGLNLIAEGLAGYNIEDARRQLSALAGCEESAQERNNRWPEYGI